MRIEVLGMGCSKCLKTKENIKTALSKLGREAELAEVKDIKSIAAYGVMLTPAVVIDGEVKIVGRVPGVEEIKEMLE